MKSIILLTLIAISTYSCSRNRPVNAQNNIANIEYKKHDTIYRDLRDFPDVKLEMNVNTLIKGMISQNCVYGSAVGYGGTYTKEYAYFERLNELLNDDEMFTLLANSNPVVRIYAYNALIIDRSNYLAEANRKLANDTSKVCTFQGCIKMSRPINQLLEK